MIETSIGLFMVLMFWLGGAVILVLGCAILLSIGIGIVGLWEAISVLRGKDRK